MNGGKVANDPACCCNPLAPCAYPPVCCSSYVFTFIGSDGMHNVVTVAQDPENAGAWDDVGPDGWQFTIDFEGSPTGLAGEFTNPETGGPDSWIFGPLQIACPPTDVSLWSRLSGTGTLESVQCTGTTGTTFWYCAHIPAGTYTDLTGTYAWSAQNVDLFSDGGASYSLWDNNVGTFSYTLNGVPATNGGVSLILQITSPCQWIVAIRLTTLGIGPTLTWSSLIGVTPEKGTYSPVSPNTNSSPSVAIGPC